MSKQITLADIDHKLDGGNMSGIVSRLIYFYHEDVAVWPTVPDGAVTPLTLEQAATLTGDVVMKPGTRAFTLDFTEDVGSFKIVPVGEVDGQHFEHDLQIIKAKIAAKVLGFMNAATDRRICFIVEDENGVNYLMGDKRRGASFITGGDGATTGAGSGDRNQTSLNFKYRVRKAYVYSGDDEDILTEVPIT